MKYYLIAGEASGDLHASHLMAEIQKADPEAQFRYFGGDKMQAVGGTLVKHYREMAYMGIVPVLLHLPTILRNMKLCRQDIVRWQSDCVILVDYPGFNLKIARYIKQHTTIPVYYYISPKVWAWKEYRVRDMKRDVDEVYSILPFEVAYFDKKDYHCQYVGNPSLDEIEQFKRQYKETKDEFLRRNKLGAKPLIAVLAGSRKTEIARNLPMMLEALRPFAGEYTPVLASAPSIDPGVYKKYIPADINLKTVSNETYQLLTHSRAALVTSGTATLETALFNIPQAVCYNTPVKPLISLLRKILIKVPYISLVNLIAGREIVRELVAGKMTAANVRDELRRMLPDGTYRRDMLEGYREMRQKLGSEGAPREAARQITAALRK